jgi:hypothetical protein
MRKGARRNRVKARGHKPEMEDKLYELFCEARLSGRKITYRYRKFRKISGKFQKLTTVLTDGLLGI